MQRIQLTKKEERKLEIAFQECKKEFGPCTEEELINLRASLRVFIIMSHR